MLILSTDDWGIFCDIVVRCMSQDLTYHKSGNDGSGNNLVPSDNKPLPEPILAKINLCLFENLIAKAN